jgi:2-(1,2-epoxy-1,2-dihydrophenyl)acetyl-CoA isomerase
MTYETIRYAIADGIATVTLNRPERMNCLNVHMRRELLDAMIRAPQEARAVVLTGEGHGFCSGQDLGDAKTLSAVDLETVLREEYEPLLRAIYDCPVPVISAVNGAAAGAGCNLALAADVVIAKQSAYFLQAFARIGLMPDAGGTYWLPRQVGFARAMGQSLFAEPVGADEAARIGLIWQSVPDEDFADEWRRRAAQLANGPTLAYGAIKRAIRGSLKADVDQQLDTEARLQEELGTTRDFREGVMAFLEKRAAKFEGR